MLGEAASLIYEAGILGIGWTKRIHCKTTSKAYEVYLASLIIKQLLYTYYAQSSVLREQLCGGKSMDLEVRPY